MLLQSVCNIYFHTCGKNYLFISIQCLEVLLLKYRSLAASGVFPSVECGVLIGTPVHRHSGPLTLSIILNAQRRNRGEFPQQGGEWRGRCELLIFIFLFRAQNHKVKVKGREAVLVVSSPLPLSSISALHTPPLGPRRKAWMGLHSARAGFKGQPHHLQAL